MIYLPYHVATSWWEITFEHGGGYILGLFTPAACGAEGKLRVIIIRVWKCWQLYIAEAALLAKWLTHSDTVTHTCLYGRRSSEDWSLRSDFSASEESCLPRASVPSRRPTVMLLCGRSILSLCAWPHYPFMWLMPLSLVALHAHKK